MRRLCLLLVLLPGWAGAEVPLIIDDIRFVGNEVTKASILRQEMQLAPGDVLDPRLLEHSRQAIMNLGLFRSVVAETLQEDERTIIQITVKERYFILPLPRLGSRSDGSQINYGLELRHNNLMGLNQRLRLMFEHRESIDGEEKLLRVWGLDYEYPRLLGTRYNLAMHSGIRKQEQVLGDEADNPGGYMRRQYAFSVGLSRWLGKPVTSEGWRAGGAFNLLRHHYSDLWGGALDYTNAQAFEAQLDIGYHQVAEHPYHRDGQSYGYTLMQSLAELGSDFDYTRHLVYWRHYRPLNRLDANINSQIRLGLASGSSFGKGAFTLGGGGVRGYKGEIGSGNAMLQLNLEYQHRISGYRPLRAVVFSDLGNVWPSPDEMDLHGFHPSVGLGLRWRAQRIVDTTLRVDYGYGLRSDETRAYFSTSASF